VRMRSRQAGRFIGAIRLYTYTQRG